MLAYLAVVLLSLPFVLATSSISVDKSCYVRSENIEISFEDAQFQSGDWIGIFRSTDNNNNLSSFLAWAWTCGSQSCTAATKSGNFALSNSLTSGLSYKAVLMRNGNGPFIALAVSSPFTVINSGQSCTDAAAVDAAHTAMRQIGAIVRGMVANDVTVTAQFLRMIFHDCIDVCDGEFRGFSCYIDDCRRCMLIRSFLLFTSRMYRHDESRQRWKSNSYRNT